MGKKATKKAGRKPNFPLMFWDTVRDRAQAAADEDCGGNLTTYINTTILSDLKERERAKARK